MAAELGAGSSEAAEGDTTDRVELETSVKSVESTTKGGPAAGEGRLDVVPFAWMHAVVGDSV